MGRSIQFAPMVNSFRHVIALQTRDRVGQGRSPDKRILLLDIGKDFAPMLRQAAQSAIAGTAGLNSKSFA